MIANEFEAFAEAISRPAAPSSLPAGRYERVTVLGGGRDAQLIAALCLAEGAAVTLFSAYGAELDSLRAAGGITVRGTGPVGTYQVDQDAVPSIRTTAELDRAVRGAEAIFLTGPVHKQRTYAMVLADHLTDGQVLVLAPGRSLGAAEAAWLLRVGGCRARHTLVEVQGLPYWCEARAATLELSTATPVAAATLPAGRDDVLARLKPFLPNIEPMASTVHSGFADGSGLVEVPALLIGGTAVGDGAVPVPIGGVPLPENASFRALIGEGQRTVIARLAAERAEVARRFGVRNLPSADEWIDIHAGTPRGDGRRPVPDRQEARALIRCATVGSLAPLVSAARVCGVAVPATEAMVTLASAVLGADLDSAGRRLEAMGVTAAGIDDARRILDAIAKGAD